MFLLHAFGQSDLGVNDTPTSGYNLLKLQIENRRYWRYSPWGPTEITTGLVGDNLLDVDVRNSVQFHKDEILQPGRSIKVFMNAKFGAEPPADKAPGGYSKGPNGYGAPVLYKAPIATAWSWAGPYIGLNLGYSAGKSKTDAVFSDATVGTPLFATGSTENLSGLIGGVQAGYNWQAGNWLGGIEADIQMSGQGAIPTYVCPGAICNPTIANFDAPVTASFVQGNKLDSFGTLRARFGTTVTPDLIAYATGGLAVGSIRTTVNLAGTAVGSRHQWNERDADRARQQLARHRQHRARRGQLQVQSRRWQLRHDSRHRHPAHLQGRALQSSALRRTDRNRVELGRPLSRDQRRLQRGKIEDRYRLQRCGCRLAPVRHRLFRQSQRRDRRFPGRLQLAIGQLGGRRRGRHPALHPEHDADLRLSRRALQSRDRRRGAGGRGA
jgi:opacity protein-like surface antigen